MVKQITKYEMDRLARKAKRMADITDMSAMTWFRYLVIKAVYEGE